MDLSRSSVILLFVGLYMVMCIAVGLWALSRTRSTRDFFMAGRDLGVWVTGLAVFSSTMSGFGFVGGPGLVYRMGMTSVWMVMSIPLGYVLCFALLAKRIRLLAELREPVSLPDAVAARYGSEGCRFLAALAILLGVMGYLATQILAMATVLRDLVAGAGLGVFSMEACVAFSCAVLVFYCVTGGIIASVYTDLVQGLVMVAAAVLVFLATAN
ncbi:MAG: sodium/proline symporter, partial [Candidatus Aminicenantes bacterium]|nr:sodium/proline symporter [Candidatus Aminicenantes bacterium]